MAKPVGKIITWNYDEITALPDEGCLYCLSDRTVSLLLTVIEFAKWKTRWYSDIGTEIDQSTINEIAEEAICQLMSCNNTILQDILAELKRLNALVKLNSTAALQQISDGTPQSIDEDVPQYAGWPVEENPTAEQVTAAEQGFCAAFSKFFFEAMEYSLRDQAAYSVSVAAALASLALLIPVGGVASIGIVIGTAFFIAEIIEAIQDSEAVRDVYCAALDGMRGKELTFENFKAALDFEDFTEEHRALMNRIMKAFMSSEENFNLFVTVVPEFTAEAAAAPDPEGCGVCSSNCQMETMPFEATGSNHSKQRIERIGANIYRVHSVKGLDAPSQAVSIRGRGGCGWRLLDWTLSDAANPNEHRYNASSRYYKRAGDPQVYGYGGGDLEMTNLIGECMEYIVWAKDYNQWNDVNDHSQGFHEPLPFYVDVEVGYDCED